MKILFLGQPLSLRKYHVEVRGAFSAFSAPSAIQTEKGSELPNEKINLHLKGRRVRRKSRIFAD